MVDQIRIITDTLVSAVENAVTRLSVNTTAELIESTPVDTGWARANWVPTIGAANSTQAENSAGESEVSSQQANQQSASASLLAGGYSINKGSVFISNNVPYIEELNEGTSNQAPAGFVQDAIKRAVRSL